MEVESFWTRTISSHWFSGLLMQPKDINKPEYTVVCHFKSSNYVINNIEIYTGNKIPKFKAISIINIDPRTWFE